VYKIAKEVSVWPNVSFVGVYGGEGFFSELRQGGFQLLCWNFENGLSSIKLKRISKDTALSEIAVGRNQICGLVNGTGDVLFWRGDKVRTPKTGHFESISPCSNLTCGIYGNRSAACWDINGTDICTKT